MKLISMTDYVLWQSEINQFDEDFTGNCIRYANFLKQPLELWMFVPCDENVNILEKPKDWQNFLEYSDVSVKGLKPELYKYAKAKERVIFDGFELINDELINNGILFWVGKFDGNEIIENCIPSNLILTDSAIKKYNL